MRDGDFRIRGKEISRVEGLSDAVFGFAITLLIISLEVPKSADEVLHAMRGFFAFAITFSLLFLVWRLQFTFFRRYGLEDNTTVNLTAVLLFVILFFVYPLKFVFNSIMERVLSHAGFPDPTTPNLFEEQHASVLLIIYALGWMAVFSVFALLHRHAYAKRDQLQLNSVEEFDTREAIANHLGTAAMGILMVVTNLLGYVARSPQDSDRLGIGMLFVIVAAAAVLVRRRRRARSRRRELVAQVHAEAAA